MVMKGFNREQSLMDELGCKPCDPRDFEEYDRAMGEAVQEMVDDQRRRRWGIPNKENQMSWSAQGTITKDMDMEPSLVMEQEQAQTGNGEKESKVALERAKEAALSFLRGGDCGYGKFKMSLSGHCNDGNVPSPGWANNSISISLYHLPPT